MSGPTCQLFYRAYPQDASESAFNHLFSAILRYGLNLMNWACTVAPVRDCDQQTYLAPVANLEPRSVHYSDEYGNMLEHNHARNILCNVYMWGCNTQLDIYLNRPSSTWCLDLIRSMHVIVATSHRCSVRRPCSLIHPADLTATA